MGIFCAHYFEGELGNCVPPPVGVEHVELLDGYAWKILTDDLPHLERGRQGEKHLPCMEVRKERELELELPPGTHTYIGVGPDGKRRRARDQSSGKNEGICF